MDAYRILMESFQIDKIKAYFNPHYRPNECPDKIFSEENVKPKPELVAHMIPDNFAAKDKRNIPFLRDVYDLIMNIEKLGEQIRKEKS